MPNIDSPTVRLNAEWGPEDPEVESLWVLLKDTIKKLTDEAVADEADFRTDRVYEKLAEARNHYIVIRDKDFTSRPKTEQDALYNSLYAALWSSYKDRLPALASSIGYDISCIFAGDKDFDNQLKAFIKRYPELESFQELIINQRRNWQNDLRDNRNIHTHDGDQRNQKSLPNLNTQVEAKKYFALVSRAIENIGIVLLSYKIPEHWNIVPVNQGATVFDRVHRYEVRHAIQGLDPKPFFDTPYH